MQRVKLNKPFWSYVMTQSVLVLIVLFASHIATALLEKHTGVSVSRLSISLWLVLLTQLPTAMLYATYESRTMTAKESWIFGFIFVLIALAAEAGLQVLAGQIWPKIEIIHNLIAAGSWQILLIGICLSLLGIILTAFTFKTVFKYAVRNNLEGKPPEPDTTWMYMIPHVRVVPAIDPVRPKQMPHDYSRLFRLVLIATNVGIFTLSLIFSGTVFLKILTVSIPLTILFAIITVANDLAKTESTPNTFKNCLDVSWKLLPLTLTALLLLGISNLYLANIQAHGQNGQFLSDISTALSEHSITALNVTIALGYLAAFFIACLAVNAGLLALFSKLIQPLIMGRRPEIGLFRNTTLEAIGFPQTPSDWVPKSPEILGILERAKASHRNLPVQIQELLTKRISARD